MRVSPDKKYVTRGGFVVTRITRQQFTETPDVLDGFPWRVWYIDEHGREDSFWANALGQYSNNTRCKSDLDLIEA